MTLVHRQGAESAESIFFMFSAETAENIKSYRPWRDETGRECNRLQYVREVELGNGRASRVVPEGQVGFCFSAFQRKAKKGDFFAPFAS